MALPYNPYADVRFCGKNYKVVKVIAQVENSESIKITNVDMIDAFIDNISRKLKNALIEELEKTDALTHTQRIDETGKTIHTMTLLVLEEADNNSHTDISKFDIQQITNNMVKPIAYTK